MTENVCDPRDLVEDLERIIKEQANRIIDLKRANQALSDEVSDKDIWVVKTMRLLKHAAATINGLSQLLSDSMEGK